MPDTITFSRSISKELGVNAAIILDRIMKGVEWHKKNHNSYFYREGKWWMSETLEKLGEYTGLTNRQARFAVKILRDSKVISTNKFYFGSSINSYTYNEEMVLSMLQKQGVAKVD